MEHKLVRLSDTELSTTRPEEDVRGLTAVDRNGQEIGEITGLLIDEQERRVRLLEVSSGGIFSLGGQKYLLPTEAVVRIESGSVMLNQDGTHVGSGPVYDPDLEKEPDYEPYYAHYGYRPYWSGDYSHPMYPFFA